MAALWGRARILSIFLYGDLYGFDIHNALHKRLGGFFAKSGSMQMLALLHILKTNHSNPPNQIAGARPLSISPESTDSARAAHSLDSPATLPVESGLPVRF